MVKRGERFDTASGVSLQTGSVAACLVDLRGCSAGISGLSSMRLTELAASDASTFP